MKPIEIAAQMLIGLDKSERQRILDILVARERNGQMLRQIAREREARIALLEQQQSRRSGVGVCFL